MSIICEEPKKNQQKKEKKSHLGAPSRLIKQGRRSVVVWRLTITEAALSLSKQLLIKTPGSVNGTGGLFFFFLSWAWPGSPHWSAGMRPPPLPYFFGST